jgi:hypothetical protein
MGTQGERRICVNLCPSVAQLFADFKAARTPGSLRMAKVEGGKGVRQPGTAKVEHVPLETYDFTFGGKTVSARPSTGYGRIKRGNF